MNRASFSMRAIMSAALAAAPIGLSACASAHETPDAVDAVLLTPQDGPTRQAIRVFVRQQSGSRVISNPDSLTQSPVLSNQERRASLGRGSSDTRESLKPMGDYRLVMDSNNRCWLIHRLKDKVTQLELPSTARCAPYRTP